MDQSGSKESNSNNGKNIFKEERSSFPTKSFAGNNLMTSKVTPPMNPFGNDNNIHPILLEIITKTLKFLLEVLEVV